MTLRGAWPEKLLKDLPHRNPPVHLAKMYKLQPGAQQPVADGAVGNRYAQTPIGAMRGLELPFLGSWAGDLKNGSRWAQAFSMIDKKVAYGPFGAVSDVA